MLILTVVFAILNICLGFALATFLGYGAHGFYKDLNSAGIDRAQTIPESAAPSSPASPSPIEATKEQPSSNK